MQWLYRLIGQVGIFLICAQTMVHFRPRESYEKYLKLLLSVMLLIQMLQPVLSLPDRTENMDAGEQMTEFMSGFENVWEQASGRIGQKEKEMQTATAAEDTEKVSTGIEVPPIEEIAEIEIEIRQKEDTE